MDNIESIQTVRDYNYFTVHQNFKPVQYSIESFITGQDETVDILWKSSVSFHLFYLIGTKIGDKPWVENSVKQKYTTFQFPSLEIVSWRPLAEKELFTIFLQNIKIKEISKQLEDNNYVSWLTSSYYQFDYKHEILNEPYPFYKLQTYDSA